MTTFDEREQGFEAKFIHEQDMEFRIKARRNHLLGVWAGGLMGLAGDGLAHYAEALMGVDVTNPGDDHLLKKIDDDLSAAKVDQSADDIRANRSHDGHALVLGGHCA